jgi:hypothetical protein
MPRYQITATDSRTGESQLSPEVLGDAYSRTYTSRKAAERECLNMNLDTAINGLVYARYAVEEVGA